MAIKIDESSASISLVWGGVKPRISGTQDAMAAHLTKGYRPPVKGQRTNMGAAWTAKGSVQVSMGLSDSMASWSFGFIQLARTNRWEAYYAGRTRKEGSTTLKPLFIGKIDIDTDLATSNPFALPPSTGSKLRGPVLTCDTSDHPHTVLSLRRSNAAAGGAENLLFEFYDDSEYWTILSLRDPGGRYTHLAHFKWAVRYTLKVYAWAEDSNDMLSARSMLVELDHTPLPKIVAGPPFELAGSGLTLDGSELSINWKFEDYLWRIGNQGGTPGLYENPDWFFNVPRDFYNRV